MMAMSDDGERTCPLCAEEMDLTDQQLKPCKCGYEICVWCWHHIIDLAEKDETVGRCPACRSKYDKERIVAMAANCERVVAEMSADKKHKGSKVRPKTSVEAKKHLTSVRVIQRNLVYIIGLPSHLCEESILERKEYFGQYGKVLKVSISRPASSQQTSNNGAFSVYITYAREEDAVRCIQYVHNYVLEGKPLRACFGTTKYCHAWLRNMTCNNPDCLYLHDVGSQEDSFTKDEVISAYSRTRVPQIASNNSQRRSGSVLPPPLDDFSIAGAGLGKNQARISSNSAPVQVRGSPPDNSVGKPVVLPTTASWGLRASSCRSSAPSSLTLPIKSKADTQKNNSSVSSLLVEDGKQPSAWNDEEATTQKISESKSNYKSPSWTNEMMVLPKVPENNGPSSIKSTWHEKVAMTSKTSESRTLTTNKSSLPASLTESSKFSSAWHDDEEVATPKAIEKKETVQGLTNQVESFKLGSWEDYELPSKEALENDFGPGSSAWNDDMVNRSKPGYLSLPDDEEDHKSAWNDDMVNRSKRGNLSSAPDEKEDHKSIEVNKLAPMNSHLLKSINTAPEVSNNHSASNVVPPTMLLGLSSMPCNKDLALASEFSDKAFPASVTMEHGDMAIQLPKQELLSSIIAKDDPVLPFDNMIPRLADSVVHKLPTRSNSGLWNNNVEVTQPSHIGVNTYNSMEPVLPLPDKEILLCDAHKEDDLSSPVDRKDLECADKSCTQGQFMEGGGKSIDHRSSGLDITGESNIISDILSLDFDPWDASLFSSNDLVKLLGEDAQQDGASMLSTAWKPQSSNQSRFSFAWQENQGNLVKPVADDSDPVEKFYSSQGASEEGFQNGPIFNHFEGNRTAITSNLFNHPDSSSGTLRSRISAPPGFSAPSKAMPPGFFSQDRLNQAYDAPYTEGPMFGGSLVRGGFQSHTAGASGDLELSDPAIMMAVGKDQMPLNFNNPGLGLAPSFAKHLTANDSDPRLHLLMQQPIPSHQNLRLPEQMGERYMSVNDLLLTSQLLAQNHSTLSPFDPMPLQQPISSHFSGQRDGWNGFHSGGDIHLGEILRNDRYGLSNYYSSSDESKFHMPSGNLYNRAFGM